MLAHMAETTATPERSRAKRGNGSKRLGPILVSGNRLAVHFGCVRSYVETLAQQGVIERRAVDGLFDMDQSRLRYIAHLRSERARSPRSTADAEHTAAKTEMLRLKLAVQRRELVRQSDRMWTIRSTKSRASRSPRSVPCRPARLSVIWRPDASLKPACSSAVKT
jgi:hypothetical protein